MECEVWCSVWMWHLFLFAMMVFQCVGLFTPKWVSTDSCSSVGIIYSCCSGPNNSTCIMNDLDSVALGLHCAAFALMLLTIGYTSYELYSRMKTRDDDWSGQFLACYYMGYLVAGILSFAGCIMIYHNQKSDFVVGYSLNLCFASSVFSFSLPFIACCSCVCCYCYKINGGDP